MYLVLGRLKLDNILQKIPLVCNLKMSIFVV